ncbi:ABC transporter permease [Gracilibacillus alcaliphilus]|uniref:ABC transporter permease n=1 Tax=Gracilibacillus alcaliphilus TaxID=1401441 RepID=UPI00195A5350|nr:ABC transporter permease [Gracilibacillus alcaliphilus]MBM7675752.1 ABC-2 type transport system permease protein [Gracilibacillus alcaliphilus]
MLLRSVYFALRRMLRGYIGFVILILLPLAIITVNGFAIGDEFVDEYGRTGMEMISIGIIIGFQLVGGFYTMETIKGDLFSENRWRLRSLPYPIYIHAISIVISSVLFNILNGTIMVLFTYWVYGVNWGNIGWAVLVLMFVSIVSQLVFLIAVTVIKKYKIAELIGYAYLFLFMILSGYLFIPIPDIVLIDWINRYINPLTLGETAIIYRMQGLETSEMYLSMGMLIVLSIILTVLIVLLGRRRLT